MTTTYNPRFSIFSRGYRNKDGQAVLATKPQQNQDIAWVYQYISSQWCAGQATETLRQMVGHASKDELSDYKKLHFETALFAGTFSYRNARGLIQRSPYMVLDVDDLDSMQQAVDLRQQLCSDRNVETDLCFVSPKGFGVKWVVTLPSWTDGLTFKQQYESMRDYMCFQYGIDPDKSGSDVSRACFLPYDPDCFINSKYLQK
jgi:hypothetical protein